MRWLPKSRRTRERELERELQDHIALEAEDRDGDVRGARRALGNATRIREDTRAEWGGAALYSLLREFRFTARGLARAPGFALGVVLTLGLGIGATTTIYSVTNGVLFQPLRYPSPDELATVGPVNASDPWIDQAANIQNLSLMSFRDFRGLEEQAGSFAGLAAIQPGTSALADAGDGPEAIQIASVSPGLFDLLGAAPVAGRAFLESEYSVAAARVAMVTYEGWQTRYGGRADVIGRPVDRLPAWTLVGVLPRGFRPPEVYFPEGEIPEFWLPLRMDDPRRDADPRGRLYVLGRLADGASVESARSEVQQIAEALAVRRPVNSGNPVIALGVNSLHAHTVGTSRSALVVFLAASGLLLLLAVMNASTILLVRSMDRTREMGVRMALGASRVRVVASILVESGVLAMLGGALGVGLAYGGVGVFLTYAPSSMPRLDSVAVDAAVLGTAAALSLLTGVLAGALPAIRQTACGPAAHLRRATGAPAEAGTGIRGTLLVGQVAVAVVLLSGAGLLINSFVRLRTTDPGFEPGGLIAMDVSIDAFARAVPGRFDSVWSAWDLALAELRAVPGVVSVAGTTAVPFQPPSWRPSVLARGASPDAARDGVAGYAVTPGFMDTMGIRVLRGRDFDRVDGPDAEPVALVNESFVRIELDGRDPLETVFVRLQDDAQSPVGFREVPTRIVGVVEDVVQARVEDGARPAVYVPYTQFAGELRAVIRTRLPADTIVPGLRRAAARFNPLFPVEHIQTLDERWDRTLTSPRFQSLIVGALAGVAILLAALGLYGFLAYAVRCREREFGIRVALGAQPSSVVMLMLRHGLGLSLAGLVIGVLASPVLTATLAAVLYGLEPGDPVTLLAVGGVLMVVSLVACLIPARRATTVDPIAVLKAE